MSDRSSILSSVHAVGTAFPGESETVCASPLCEVRFPQTGLEMSPKRFCCEQCRQQASLIRRVGALLNDLSDEKLIRILRNL
jgi:hypothetical protein